MDPLKLQHTDEQEQLNRDKYGSREDDVIARAYRESHFGGNFYCAKNSEKYLRRFCGNSHKAGNLADLLKVKDYVERMIAANQDLKQEEIIERHTKQG